MTHPDTERLLAARKVRFEFVDALPLGEVHEPTSAEQQYRVEVYDPATVVRYRADLEAGDQFPPLIVRRRNKTGGYVLLSGMHRWHAARELEWDTFPAYLVRCTPAVGRLISFDANRTHGKPLSPSELGELAARLVELDGMTAEAAQGVPSGRTHQGSHQAATTHAQAASARYTTERTRDAYEAMGAAWQAADRAMRAMFDARAAMCDVVLAGGQQVML